MFGAKPVVGGEFVFSPSLLFSPKLGQFSHYGEGLNQYHRYYTFGAYYSIKAIIESLECIPGDYILLPSYLCPSIIAPFAEAGVRYDFYKMKEGLVPDIEDISHKTKTGLRAVFFIDYFGIPQKDILAPLVASLRARGVSVIQDTVQSWLNNEADLYGDYCFNSVRKFAPFEASVLFSSVPLNIKSSTKAIKPFLYHKRYAQLLRFAHLNYGLFKPESFLHHIDKSNQCYHQSGIIGMPNQNKVMLDRLDFAAMGRKRRLVYKTLLAQLPITPVLKQDIGDNVPLGLPIYLENRNELKGKLHGMDIHCPLHWLLSDEIDKQEHEYSWELSRHELTLPLNVKLHQLSDYLNKLKELL